MHTLLNSKKTKRNRFTRMCIGEALLTLMEHRDYESIKISDIVTKAGISRMTYYNYYHSKAEILEDYFQEIVAKYLASFPEEQKKKQVASFWDYHTILHSLNFFDQYADFLQTLVRAGLYSVILDAVNRFMTEHILPEYQGSVYHLYYYAGGLLNSFLKWQEGGKKETPEEMAQIIASFIP